jgi:Flp pilus assembly protein TadD
MNDPLRSALTLADGLPYFKDNFFEKRFHKFILRGGVIVLLIIAAYIPAWSGKVLWIDKTEANHELLMRSSGGLAQVWAHPSILPTWQPMADTVLWVEHYFFGKDGALGYHLTSLGFHCANCMLVWFALRRLNVPAAWLVAAIFGLHPMLVQAVAWVGGQPMLIGTFCYGLSMILYLRFAQIEPAEELDPTVKLSEEWYSTHPEEPAVAVTLGAMPRVCYVFSFILFLCAVLSDQTAWSLPIILLLLLWWRGGHGTPKDIKSLLPYFIVGALALLFGVAQSELYAYRFDVARELSLIGRLLLPGRVLAYDLFKLIFPFWLSFVGPQWTVSALSWWQYLYLIALIGAAVLFWQNRKRIAKGPMVGIIFILLNTLPSLGLTKSGWMRYTFAGEYLQYRATIGEIALLVSGLMWWIARSKSDHDMRRIWRVVAAVVLLVPLTSFAVVECLDYQTPETLWLAALNIDPHAEAAMLQLASYYLNEEKPEPRKAISEIEKWFHGNKPTATMLVAYGDALEANGDWDYALEQFRKAVEIDNENVEALKRLAAALARQGKIDKAIPTYLHILRLKPNDGKANASVGNLYALDDATLSLAIKYLLAAIDAEPNSLDHHLTLARLYFRRAKLPHRSQIDQDADLKKSSEELQDAAKIDPNNFDVFMLSGELLTRLERYDLAEHAYKSAVHKNPKSWEAWNNLGVAVATQGRFAEAKYYFGKARELNPEFDAARRNMEAAIAAERNKNSPAPTTSPGN